MYIHTHTHTHTYIYVCMYDHYFVGKKRENSIVFSN